MGVLLGLGDVELAAARLADDPRDRRLGLRRRERDRVGPLLAVGGHRGDVEVGKGAAGEPVEVRVGERGDDLPHPVGPEVEADDDVAALHAVVAADDGRRDELVGDVVLVGGGDRLGGGGGALALGVDDRVVGALDPLPALVAVHREVAAADGADAARRAQPALDLLDVLRAARRARVAPVGEGMERRDRGPPRSRRARCTPRGAPSPNGRRRRTSARSDAGARAGSAAPARRRRRGRRSRRSCRRRWRRRSGPGPA